MNKAMILAAALFLMAGQWPCAAVDPTEDDYREFNQMRSKFVRMKKEMDRFMKDVIYASPGQDAGNLEYFGQDVRVDVIENDKNILVRADLPGMEKDKIQVVLENNRILKISGEREVVKSQTSPGLVRQERMAGKFERTLELPAECLSEGIKAAYKNGVLEVVIPKRAEVPAKAVKVNIQ